MRARAISSDVSCRISKIKLILRNIVYCEFCCRLYREATLYINLELVVALELCRDEYCKNAILCEALNLDFAVLAY